MQKNPVNKNGEERSMSSRTTSMHLNQRANEKMRRAHRSIRNKSIQKRTSFQSNGVQMRDMPNGMARNPKNEIMSLDQLVRGDSRIETPLDRNTSNK